MFRTFMTWVDQRLPVTATFERHLSKHMVPKKVNLWYLLGALAATVMIIQYGSGIWLMMFYDPSPALAFESVQHIARDVEFGWLLRYLHSTGASMFFLIIYLHMFRGLLYGSYRAPRELVWVFGCFLYLLMMAEGFLGYVLPWGQMSYWAAQVIVSLFGAIPLVGDTLVTWVRGDYLISDATLSRFFALHAIVVPLIMLAFVLFHLMGLHEVGAGNPDGIDIEADTDATGRPKDGIPFFPYKVLQAIVGIGVTLIIMLGIAFYFPTVGGYFIEAANYEEANPLSTPEHIVPVWYYMPYYAMLRAVTFPLLGIDGKFWGLVIMGLAVVMFVFLPWLDRSPVSSIRYRGMGTKVFLGIFVVCFLMLGYLGAVPTTEFRKVLAQICTLGYFSYFLLMPIYTARERCKPVPPRL